MIKKRAVVLIALAAFVFGVSQFILAKEKDGPPPTEKDDLYGQVALFANAISIIRNDYVAPTRPKDLIYGAMKGMLMSLDSHSQFMDPESYREMKVETEGKFGGIGIEITLRDGIVTVISPIEDTPAFKAGLRPNDKIVRIDGKSTRDAALDETVKKLRGEPGTIVTLTILREEEKRLMDVVITRGLIEIKSVKEARVLEDGIGYIKIIEFQENTPRDLAKALAGLKAKNIDSLILDLRNNPGGLLETSVRVSEMFLPQGKLVVTTRGRVKDQDMVYRSGYGRPYTEFMLVVIVNEGSASASEIVAGAVKDNRRGIVVGAKTFGKGSVQTVIPLSDGSAIRLTTAEYFTPSGKAINNKGITPDVAVAKFKGMPQRPKDQESEEEEEEEIFERPELKEPDGKKTENPKAYDAQLEAAVNLIKGIRSYESLKVAAK